MTPDICANVIPSGQPLAIQKKIDVARQIATESADSEAIPMSRCWAGIVSGAVKRRVALAVFSSSRDSRRVRHSSDIRRIFTRFREALARRRFSQE
ncbi:hypothetical protein D3C78_1139060 [compost metagenome]